MKAIKVFLLITSLLTVQIIHAQSNIGINKSNPEESLHVGGGILADRASSNSNPQLELKDTGGLAEYTRFKLSNSGINTDYWMFTARPKSTGIQGNLHFFNPSLGNAMTIRDNGNVGINVSNPTSALHMNIISGQDLLRIQRNSSTVLRIFDNRSISLGSNNENVSAGNVYIHTNLGLGVSNPQQKLDVSGTIKANSIQLTTGASTGYVLRSNSSGTGSWVNPDIFGDDLGDHQANTILSMGGNRIIKVEDPQNNDDAATKLYVDSHTDADASTSNEAISSLNLNGSILEVNEGGTQIDVDLSPLGGMGDNLGSHSATTFLDMNTQRVVDVGWPLSSTDAATKGYVDANGGGGADSDWTVAGNNMYSEPSGNVGIGATGPLSKLSVGANGRADAVVSVHTDQSGEIGVFGRSVETSSTVNYGGYFESNSIAGIGVFGEKTNSNHDIFGAESYGGFFRGNGQASHGVYGEADHGSGNGVYGFHTFNGAAVKGETVSGTGVSGSSTNGLGGFFKSINGTGISVMGDGDGDGAGIFSSAGTNSSTLRLTNSGTGYGLVIDAQGNDSNAMWAIANGTTNVRAAIFSGDVLINGNVSKTSGSFMMDHPSDPANKYLYHSFVESPDMMNVYNGNVTTDADGFAVVSLPDYFEDLNMEFRYQLTVLGQFAQAIVKDKVHENQFKIQTDQANVEVSWQVTGIRKDPYAVANRIPNVVEKEGREKGKYLHPEVYGLPYSMGIWRTPPPVNP